MAVLLGLLVTFFAVGFVGGTWRYIWVPLLLSAVFAVFLWANNGWYGHGWGEFGVLFNALACATAATATATGVILRRALSKEP